jgi:prepilin-type N-terminal cleavage/methylation domain-containing protein
MMSKQQGFTLVEIVIVAVIVGLLLGSVIKGQELVTNAKVKNVEANFNSLAQAIYTYQERYNALPGDDGNAKNRFGISSTATVTPNGKIGGNYKEATSGSTAGESGLAWQHLRAAGLIEGSPTDFVGPMNAFGGRIGIGMNSVWMPWVFIGFTNIPNHIGIIFEEHSDGWPLNSQQGRVRVENGTTLSNDNYRDNKMLLNLLFSL